MRNELKYILLGLWIALVPFLGFPSSWKTFFVVISALAIVALSIWHIAKERLASLQNSQGFTSGATKAQENETQEHRDV